jgi:two-component system, cell cycle response regulator
LEETPLKEGEKEMKVTASFGIASFLRDQADGDRLIKNADSALYEAKNAGRNRVQVYGGETFLGNTI